MVFLNITSFLGELGDNPEKLLKISKKKILFIFCIFLLYKIISISLDLTFKFLNLSFEMMFNGFQVDCIQIYNHNTLSHSEKIVTLNCKYNILFKI